MQHFWEHMIAPVLPLLQPKHIVEIGAKDGCNTARIARYCRGHGATLHCIEKAASPQLKAVLQTYDDVVQFYEGENWTDVLNIQQIDLVMVHDNSNWHDILRTLQARTGTSSMLPILLLQDVEQTSAPGTQEEEKLRALEQERDSALQKQRIIQEKLLVLQERISHFEKQMGYVSSSFSWRCTAPLRSIRIFLQKLKR